MERLRRHIGVLYGLILALFFLAVLIGGVFFGDSVIHKRVSTILELSMFFCMAVHAIYFYFSAKGRPYPNCGQIWGIYIALALFWNAANFGITGAPYVNTAARYGGLFVLDLCCVIWGILFLASLNKPSFSVRIKKDDLGLAIVILVFVLLNLKIGTYLLKIDSLTYYTSIVNRSQTWDFTFRDLSPFEMAGHKSYAFMPLLYIGYYLYPYNGAGVRFMVVVLSCITIFAVNKILPKLFPNMMPLEQTLLTALFAFYPLFFQNTSEIFTDYAVMCFFIWMLFAYLYGYRLWFVFFSMALCFSKENGIALCGAFVLGCILADFIAGRHISLAARLRKCIRKEYFYILFFALFFIVIFLFSKGGWGGKALSSIGTGESLFRLDFAYIGIKLKQMFFFNFTWILIALMVIGLICKIGRKRGRQKVTSRAFIPLIFSFLAFLITQLMVFTYDHYRYIILFTLFYTLIAGMSLREIFRKKTALRNFTLLCVMLVNFISCYEVLDPVTLMWFDTVNVGKKSVPIVKSCYDEGNGVQLGDGRVNFQFFDGLEYNRQQVQFELLMEKFLADIHYNGKINIAFPGLYFNSSHTLYQLLGNREGKYYWDPYTKNITLDPSDIYIRFIDDDIDKWDSAYEELPLYYITLPYSDTYDLMPKLTDRAVIEQSQYSQNGWDMTVYLLAAK